MLHRSIEDAYRTQLRDKLVFLLLYLDSRERHLDFHQTVQWDAVRRHWLVVMPEALCK